MIEQTRTKPQETLELVLSNHMQIFPFSPPINLTERSKWSLGRTSFDCTNSVFNITDENKSFSITIPDHWENKSAEKTIDELNELKELKSLELHVKEVEKRGSKIKLGDNECKISDFDTQKNEIPENLKIAK